MIRLKSLLETSAKRGREDVKTQPLPRAAAAAPAVIGPGDYEDVMRGLSVELEKLCFDMAATDILQRSGVSSSLHNRTSKQHEGDALVEQLPGTADLKNILRLLGEFNMPGKKDEKLVRTGYQVDVHRRVIRAISPMVYGDDIDRYPNLIRQYWKFEDLCTRVAVMWPRRHGKTWAMATILAAMAYTLRGKRWIILSTGERASGEMMAHTLSFFLQLPGAKGMIAKHTSEHLIISQTRDPNDSEAFHLYSLPDSPTKIRGITAHGMVFEEAAFIGEGMYNEVALPLDGVNRSCILAISSPPKESFNYFFKFFDLKNKDGKRVYDGIKIDSMCDTCRENNAEECPHRQDFERPPWKSLEKEKDLRAQYGNNKTQLRREIYGVAESDELSVFRKPDIERLYANPPYTFRRPPHYIIIAIDPCGGGTGSDTAWTAVAADEFDRFVVRIQASHSP